MGAMAKQQQGRVKFHARETNDLLGTCLLASVEKWNVR
jgi:hypothetical protein